jgi:A/G-specific adenine glycosylase
VRNSARDVRDFRRRLLAFYDAAKRDLPWRRQRDPYAIWISEIMAQQTRIDTVVPYWQRWMQRFPDVNALASADLDEVLKLWEGLGYYSRARNLHAAAQVVRERHNGRLPDTAEALRALPGIGDYTAGAVASMAYGRAAAAVDGNVRRVLARLLDDPQPSSARLQSVAAELVDADRPGEFNQAFMELGSLVCTPRAPQCGTCPVSAHCAAFRNGTQLERPQAQPKRPTPTYDVATLVLRRPDGHVLLTRRPEAGLLAGMWTFPGVEFRKGGSGEAAQQLARSLGVRTARHPRRLGSIRHVFSHRREVYHCELLEVTTAQASRVPDEAAAWVGADRTGVTLPRAQQKIHALVFG